VIFAHARAREVATATLDAVHDLMHTRYSSASG
jgi:hypothetical protein